MNRANKRFWTRGFTDVQCRVSSFDHGEESGIDLEGGHLGFAPCTPIWTMYRSDYDPVELSVLLEVQRLMDRFEEYVDECIRAYSKGDPSKARQMSSYARTCRDKASGLLDWRDNAGIVG